jgi:hypothetical protein
MTQVLPNRDPETAATRVESRRSAGGMAAPPVRRLEPRRYETDPYARPAPAPARAAEQPRRSSAARRFFALLLLALVFAAAVGAAVVISTSTSNTVVQIRTTFSHDVNSAIQQAQNLISQYTK